MSFYKIVKRGVDLFCAATGIVVLAPLLLPVMILMKFSGDGSIFYFQKRVGFRNAIFDIWKFATMVDGYYVNAGSSFTVKDDPRITPVGKILRKTKLNEIPQLINVIKGDMSLVGPRPVLPKGDFDNYTKKAQEVIYKARPGITGIGSVVFRDEEDLITQIKDQGGDHKDFYNKTICPYKGELEIWYEENRSFWVDVKILILTGWTVLFPVSQIAFSSFDDLPERPTALKQEQDKMVQLRESVTLAVLGLVALIPIVPPPFWFLNNLQYILFSAFSVVGLCYLIYRHEKMILPLSRWDLGWVVFLSIGFVSYLWAVDGSLIWYQLFGWSIYILFMLVFRSVVLKDTAVFLLPYLFCLFFVVLLTYHLVALFQGTALDANWNTFFGKNANHSSTFLLSFFPFLLFYSTKKYLIKGFKVLSLIALMFIFYHTTARGALFSLIVVLLYYFWTFENKKILGYVLLSISISSMFIFMLISDSSMGVSEIPIIKTSIDQMSSRLYMSWSSVQIFFEKPLTGIGFGNWHTEAYKYGVSEIFPFNTPEQIVRHKSHNLYVRLFAELGFVGGVSFVLPILAVLRLGSLRAKKLLPFQKAACASLLVYLVSSYFYSTSNFTDYLFSGIQVLGFASIGILTSERESKRVASKGLKFTFLVISVICTIWFVYSKWSYDSFKMSESAIKSEDHQLAIEKLENIYSPVFKTNFDYHTPLSLILAKEYLLIGEYDTAEKYFKDGLSRAPYSEQLLIGYADFLYEYKNNNVGALEHIERLLHIQNNYQKALYLKEEILSELN